MLAKNLYSNAEATFWDMVIIILGGLRWIVNHKRKLLGLIFQSVAWSTVGFLIGLGTGFITF
ncbi:MAG: hypothetical protein A2032_04560 [Chloroflexi bacterium RBG_19FT_COMBO_49_13]|nr:MAG: hypothetical protein A2032_04560 [Chloroflexi bacterium RBG_19FT_COMBO_49_13]